MLRSFLVILAGLVLMAAGCGRDVNPPSLENARRAKEQGDNYLREKQLPNAEQSYRAAVRLAEGSMKGMVPGDPLLAEAENIRSESARAVGEIKETLRKQEAAAAAGTGTQVASAKKGTSTKNLAPTSAPYKAEPLPVKPPDGEKQPDPTAPPTTPNPTPTPTPTPTPADPPKTDPAPTTPPEKVNKDPETPKPPAERKAVRINKVVLKGGKTFIIYWTLTNMSANQDLTLGAPAGNAVSKGGKNLLSIRGPVFLKAGFNLNPENPGASEGKTMSIGNTLAPGESREVILVGQLEEANAALVAGAVVELRQNDGNDLSDKLMEVVRE